ncbi:hypothetical protein ACTA71_001998 [Dictyostelium dimigraforme]
MKSNLVIVFLILLLNFDFIICNQSISCNYMKEGLNLAPTTIYSIITETNNITNRIITRTDIKNNSTTIQLFNFNLVNNGSDFENLMDIINNQTILINTLNKGSLEKDISYISLNDNELKKFNFSIEFQGKQIGTRDLFNPILILNNGSNNQCLENTTVNYSITGLLEMNKIITIASSNGIIKSIDLNKTFEQNDTIIYLDKSFLDYYITSVSTNEIFKINLNDYNSSLQSFKFKNNIIGAFNKTIYTSSFNQTSNQYSVFSNSIQVNESLTPSSQFLCQIGFNISNIIPSENQNYILLYSSFNEKLVIYNIEMNSTQQIDQFTINIVNSTFQTFVIHSLIARGGSPIEPSIPVVTSTPEKTESPIKKEEKVAIPIIVVFICILSVLGIAMTIKIVLKKRKEKKNFIKLNESGLLVDENNINLDFPIHSDNQI